MGRLASNRVIYVGDGHPAINQFEVWIRLPEGEKTLTGVTVRVL